MPTYAYQDGHIGMHPITVTNTSLIPLLDLPILVRGRFANNASAFDLHEAVVGHVDIPRLRKGKVGGFFW